MSLNLQSDKRTTFSLLWGWVYLSQCWFVKCGQVTLIAGTSPLTGSWAEKCIVQALLMNSLCCTWVKSLHTHLPILVRIFLLSEESQLCSPSELNFFLSKFFPFQLWRSYNTGCPCCFDTVSSAAVVSLQYHPCALFPGAFSRGTMLLSLQVFTSQVLADSRWQQREHMGCFVGLLLQKQQAIMKP